MQLALLTAGMIVVALVVLEGWIILQVLRQQGRLLLRVEALEAHSSASITPSLPAAVGTQLHTSVGLPIGASAPGFGLPNLAGETITLDDLRAQGKPILLLFSDPACGPCTALLPEIGHWQSDYADKLTLALLSRGSRKANSAKSEEEGISHVLLQTDREAAEAYQVPGTPSAVLVRHDGTIGSPLAVGADAIRELVSSTVATLANGGGSEASSYQNRLLASTVGDAVEQGMYALLRKGQMDARLSAEKLLSHVLRVERRTLDAQCQLSLIQEQEFLRLLERCGDGEPVAYLVGHQAFYGHDFLVDKRVMIPRADTERLTDAALSAVRHMLHAGRIPLVAEIGTGSGAIAITLAVEEPRLPYLYATDISAEALEVAHLNCQRHSVEQRIHLLHGDLLVPLPEPVDILIANLPYIGTIELDIVVPVVREHEPHQALFGGPNGLELLQRFFVEAQQSSILRDKAIMLLEIDHRQREPLTALLHEIWPQATISFSKDCFGVDRVLQAFL